MPISTQPTGIPRWASNLVQVIEPSELKKDVGFIPTEKPANQTTNWILYKGAEWDAYYKSYFDTITNSNVVFDDTNKILKLSQGHLESEKADSSVVQSGSGLSRISIRNTNGTANNFSDLLFLNQNNNVTAKLSSKYINHTNGETDLSFWATPASGSLTEYMRILSGGNIGIGITPTEKLHVNGNGIFVGKVNINSHLIKTVSGTAANNAFVDIELEATLFCGILCVENENQASATQRTSKVFATSGRLTDGFVATQLSSHDGGTSGMAFSVTNPSANILRVTNLGGVSSIINISYSGINL